MIGVREDLRSLTGYHSPQVDVPVRLNTNESPVGPPAEFSARLAAAVAAVQWNRYPDREARQLRAALAAHHDVDPSRVFVANGSNEVIQTLLLTFAGAGRTVATFEPTYQLHAHLARLSGATVVSGERGPGFALDMAEVERVVRTHRPEVAFLCSPNNPTGVVDRPDAVRTLIELTEGLVVVDEAYAQFAEWSALELLDDTTPMVVVRTFSKTWSMAAARLGYLIGPASIVAALEQVVLPYHLDTVTQLAGCLALEYTDAMHERVAALIDERERIAAALDQMPVHAVPSGANFILFKPEHGDGRRVWEGLLERDVLIRDCSGWPRLDGHLRVTVGTAHENDRFLGALKEVLS